MILGIDFGTCYSSVAVMVGDEPVTSYLESSSILGVPSYFLYHDGEKYYGEDCESMNLFPYRGDIIKKMKREIRASPGNMDNLYSSGGRNFILKSIVEDYLRYLITKVKTKVDQDSSFLGNKEIEAVTITAPVAIGKNHELATAYMEFLQNAIFNITHIDKRISTFLVNRPRPPCHTSTRTIMQNMTKNRPSLFSILVAVPSILFWSNTIQ